VPQLINKPWHYVEHKILSGALAVCFAADNMLLSVDNHTINWFDCQTKSIVQSVLYEYEHIGGLPDICFDKKGQHLVVMGKRGGYITDLSFLDQPAISIECKGFQHYGVITVCSNHDDSTLAIALHSSHIYLYDMKTGKKEEHIIGYGSVGSLQNICFSPIESICAVLNNENKIIIGSDISQGWRMEQQCVIPQEKSVESLCFNHDGTQLAVSHDDNLSIFDANTGQLLWSILFKDLMSVCFDGVGNRVAVGSPDITRIIAQYDNYTLDQLMLRKIMYLWLQLKKPKSNICSVEKVFKNIACLLRLDRKELDTVWSSFPEFMQVAIAETILTKIACYKQQFIGIEKHKECCKKKAKKVKEAIKKKYHGKR
jgi:WD40 repeat protein